jgi:pyrroloquinoline quinone biosynthesis protein D
MLDDTLRVVRSDDVVSRTLRDETLLMDMRSEQYLSLDSVATRIWSLLDGERSLADVAAVIADEYDAPLERIRADLHALLQQLLDLGLVSRAA